MTDSPVTFLFTDIEGSTRLLRQVGPAYPELLERHRALISDAASAHRGRTFGSDGDALFVAFDDPRDAIAAAADAQRRLSSEPWPGGPVRVRMGIHSGPVAAVGSDYVGLPLHEAARVTAAGHGGQVVVSEVTAALVGAGLPADVVLRDLGAHRLKDLPDPVRLFQLVAPGLDDAFPPLRTLGAETHLPSQLTSFVGRPEVALARELLGQTRLLTITGPGGTGKTRLALEVAALSAEAYADGAAFVALETVLDPELIAPTVLTALGIVDTSGGPPLDRLVEAIAARRLLLVLDNYEQVLAGASVVSALLKGAAGLTVIVTSRAPLRVTGEQELPLPPLELPRVGPSVTAEAVLGSAAGRLFVERAAAVQPAFRLTDANAPLVAEIVERLDGLPLAVELAAARTRVLSLDALRSRLTSALGTLVGGARDLPARQQTLRGAIDWSYELLEPPDRRLFARCAVFEGAGSLPELEAVCGPSAELGEEPLDGCASLVEKSLLRSVLDAGAEPRFAMLVTIRDYATERLEASGEAPLVQRRHAQAYLALAEQAAPALTGATAGLWLDRLETDHDNLRAALAWAIAEQDLDIALRLIAALWRFWQLRGHLHEARRRVETVLGLPGVDAAPALLRTRALGAAGSLAYWRGEWSDAHHLYTAAVSAARESNDPATLAEALYNLGFSPNTTVETQDERYRAGAPFFREALGLYEALADARGMANTQWALSFVSGLRGDLAAAREQLAASIGAYRAIDDQFGLGYALHAQGLVELSDGKLSDARPAFVEGLEVFQRTGDVGGILWVLVDLAMLRRAEGDEAAYWRIGGAVEHLRLETGTDLISNPTFGLPWEAPKDPSTEAAAREWALGQAMTVEAAIEDAIALPTPPARR
jgi:predicted ATPase/class 3 adenylate cyclase